MLGTTTGSSPVDSTMKDIKTSNSCNVCGSTELGTVFDAPALPLTGIYTKDDSPAELPVFDQSLMICRACGHGQLRNLVSPSVLYDETYTHRTSTSPIATRGNDFFYAKLEKILAGRTVKSLLEIGCNDLYLLNKAQGLSERLTGIDPIWAGRDHDLNHKTRVLGRFVEDLKRGNDLDSPPNLIISAHTFEHVQDLYGQMASLVEIAAEKCLFVIEMPSLDSLIKLRRFDQVFHQHIQYISLSSIRRLVSRLDCTFLGHEFNYSYWGGTILFWFVKERAADQALAPVTHNPETVKQAFMEFQRSLQGCTEQLAALEEPCFGFGAAQMLPVLGYHMKSNLDFLDAILDDNPDRAMTRLPGVSPLIRPVRGNELEDAAVLITALDSARPILRRVLDLKPRRIIVPLHNF